MKIRQIRFKNINSFYGEHPPIVFTEGVLGQTGLFVISGPTGAGKSTLLDVITLALFNRVPRISDSDGRGLSKEKILNEGLIINRQAVHESKTEAYAEIEYELKGQAYRSRWSIAKNRNGNWNDYDMEVAKLPDGTLVSDKKRDVPSLNTEQIGLTYEQFIRSMVLAQGAFDKFLKASSGDRSKLLEQITGTDIYRRLSQRSHQKNREYDDLVKDKKREVSLVRLLSDERVGELTAERTQIDARLKAVEQELTFYRAEVEQVDAGSLAEKELLEISRKQSHLTDKQTAFAPERARLDCHEQVADLTADLSNLAHAEARSQQAAQNEHKAQAAIADTQINLSGLIEQARALTRQPALTEQSFNADLTNFRDEVLDLVQQIKTERERVMQPRQSIRTTLETATHEWFRALNADDVDQTTRQIAARRAEVGVELVQLEDEYPTMTPDQLGLAIDRYHEREKQLLALIQLQEQQRQRQIDGMELTKKVDEKQGFISLHRPALQQLLEELNQLDEQKKTIEQQKNRLAREADLDQLRQGLTTGDPCPLCGSVEHPYAQHYVQQAGTIDVQLLLITDDIAAKKKAFDTLNTQLIKAETDQGNYDKQRQALRTLFSQSKESISAQLSVLTLEPTLQIEELRDEQQLAQVQRRELSRLAALWDQEKTLDRLTKDLEALQSSTVRIDQLIREKERLFAGNDVKERCHHLSTQFNRLTAELLTQTGLRNQAAGAADEANRQVEALLADLQPVLAARGLADAASARACLLDAATVRQLQDTQRALADEALSLSLRREQQEAKRQAAADARQTDLPADVVKQHVVSFEKEQRQKIEQLGSVKAQLAANEREQKRQIRLANELAGLEAEAMPWQELDKLIGSAKGDEYSRFAQGLTLAQLIGLANQRLRDLSDRYLLLKPRDGQDELYVLDQYQGGAERTVTSLSGGETFTLSLALALALSDLASQNVKIESLFVDEGFGTLDPDSLDTAIVMLEKLQQESQKTIGIISHRHEIKERISVQIQIERSNDGNSRVAVVEL